MSVPLPQTVTLADLADLFGLSATTANDLKKRGLFRRIERGQYDLRESVRAYTGHLRETAAGRAGDADGLDLASERARLAKEQADKISMENAVSRGELLPAGEVTAAVQAAFARVRARLLAIPSKAAPLVVTVETPAEVQDVISAQVVQALEELSGTVIVTVPDDTGTGDGEGVSGLVDDPASAAPADGQPVG